MNGHWGGWDPSNPWKGHFPLEAHSHGFDRVWGAIYVTTESCISVKPNLLNERTFACARIPPARLLVNNMPTLVLHDHSQRVEHRNHRKKKLSAHKSCVLRQMRKSSLKVLENWVNCIVLGPVVNKNKEEPRGKFRRNQLIELAKNWPICTLPLITWLSITPCCFPLFQRLRALGAEICESHLFIQKLGVK